MTNGMGEGLSRKRKSETTTHKIQLWKACEILRHLLKLPDAAPFDSCPFMLRYEKEGGLTLQTHS